MFEPIHIDIKDLASAYNELRDAEAELQRKFQQKRAFGHRNVVSLQQRTTIEAYINFYKQLIEFVSHQDLAMTEAKLMISLRMTFRDFGEQWLTDPRQFKLAMTNLGITLPE